MNPILNGKGRRLVADLEPYLDGTKDCVDPNRMWVDSLPIYWRVNPLLVRALFSTNHVELVCLLLRFHANPNLAFANLCFKWPFRIDSCIFATWCTPIS